MQNKTSKFLFEEIDLEHGSCTVRFINPVGVIETGEKTLNDFKETIQVPTGSFNLDGTRITQPMEIVTNENPNDDIIYAYDIPLDNNGEYISKTDLIDYIAKQYPHSVFEQKKMRFEADKNKAATLNTLKNQRFDVEIIEQSQSTPPPSANRLDIVIEEI